MDEPLRVISFGGGVQTTALAILNARGEVPNPARICLMADTGGERPETYAYLREHFRPWAESVGMEVIVTQGRQGDLYAYAWRRKMVPSINTRWCTDQFKVRVINAWIRAHGATAQAPCDMQIGISADESHRARDGMPRRYAKRRWPLVDMRLTRKDCRAIIAEAGLPEPVKSGCWYCPFQSQNGWRRLRIEHPDLADQAIALEANARERNPRDVIGPGRPLPEFYGNGVQVSWDAFLEQEAGCVSGACFV